MTHLLGPLEDDFFLQDVLLEELLEDEGHPGQEGRLPDEIENFPILGNAPKITLDIFPALFIASGFCIIYCSMLIVATTTVEVGRFTHFYQT